MVQGKTKDEAVAVFLSSTLLTGVTFASGCAATTPARCAFADFSIGAAHMTIPIREPFVVRELRGRFWPDFTDARDWGADQPQYWRFQINGPENFSVEVPVARDGSFQVRGLRPGRYCFKTSSALFQAHEGVIVISPYAPDVPIEIKVLMGV